MSNQDDDPLAGLERDCAIGFLVGALAGACLWTGLAIVAAYLGWLP
jgi:hypothetical protein